MGLHNRAAVSHKCARLTSACRRRGCAAMTAMAIAGHVESWGRSL